MFSNIFWQNMVKCLQCNRYCKLSHFIRNSSTNTSNTSSSMKYQWSAKHSCPNYHDATILKATSVRAMCTGATSAVDNQASLDFESRTWQQKVTVYFGATTYILISSHDIMPRWHCGWCHSLPEVILLNTPLQRGDNPSLVECRWCFSLGRNLVSMSAVILEVGQYSSFT